MAAERRDGVMNKSGELLQSKGGAPAMSKADRSKFLEGLHLLLEREKRRQADATTKRCACRAR